MSLLQGHRKHLKLGGTQYFAGTLFLRKRGHFLKINRALLRLLQNIGGYVPQVPHGLYFYDLLHGHDYKIMNGLCPDNFRGRLDIRFQTSNYPTRNQLDFDTSRQNLEFSKAVFSIVQRCGMNSYQK